MVFSNLPQQQRELPEDGTTNLWGVSRLSEVHRVPVASLRPADSPRHQSEQAEHTHLLANSAQELPPIVVHRQSMQVVDGMHRVRAAELRGQSEIRARFFDGAPEDAFALAVRANTSHGLPLSLSERTAAAVRILTTHPHWSNRAIAAVAGLSAKTVAAQRRKLGPATQTTARIGRDGRVRPANSAEGRRLAGRLILESPGASLRAIAQKAGISPGTVRDVRARLLRGEDIVPLRHRLDENGRGGLNENRQSGERRPPVARLVAAPPPAPGRDDSGVSGIFPSLCRDPSLRLTENGRRLLRMLELHTLDGQGWQSVAQSVPAHRAQIVSELALECARQWQRFASQVRERAVAPVA
ncbi:ParB/RepB/Spo0J family partition protein [Streptomyces sp. Y1]|uniref:ParB/RepB/Spo0J family partition protein n=1 Tax=Streptomyces sp. Y1 TaxID=3238634 RepID=A0AB39TX13_9ACTN